jgi:hypothetical protein
LIGVVNVRDLNSINKHLIGICRGGPLWPPQGSTLCFLAGAATEGRPYSSFDYTE